LIINSRSPDGVALISLFPDWMLFVITEEELIEVVVEAVCTKIGGLESMKS